MTNDRLKLIKEMLETNPDDSFLKYAAALEYETDGKIKKSYRNNQGSIGA